MLLDTCIYAMLVTASHLVQKEIAGEKNLPFHYSCH